MEPLRKALYHSLLWQFCEQEVGRYALYAPWRTGDSLVATDGRRLLEITGLECPPWESDIDKSKRRPNVQGVLDDLQYKWNDEEWVPLGSWCRRVDYSGDDYDRTSNWEQIEVCGVLVNREYIYWLSIIPDIEVKTSSDKRALIFRAESLRAVVMAISPNTLGEEK